MVLSTSFLNRRLVEGLVYGTVAITCLVIFVLDRAVWVTGFRSSVYAFINAIFATILLLRLNKTTRWHRFHQYYTCFTMFISIICYAIVVGIIRSPAKGENHGLLVWSIIGFLQTILLIVSRTSSSEYDRVKATKPSMLRKIYKMIRFGMVEILFAIFSLTLYSSIHRATDYVTLYNNVLSDREVFDGISYQTDCFCNGRWSSFPSCYNLQSLKRVAMFEMGLVGTSSFYASFLSALSEYLPSYTICTINRRGIGWSDPVKPEQSGSVEENVSVLIEWLKRKQISDPVTLIGHGYGGWHIFFAGYKYPRLANKMIFIESLPLIFNGTSDRLRLPELPTGIANAVGIVDSIAYIIADVKAVKSIVRPHPLSELTDFDLFHIAIQLLSTQTLESWVRDDQRNHDISRKTVKSVCTESDRSNRPGSSVKALFLASSKSVMAACNISWLNITFLSMGDEDPMLYYWNSVSSPSHRNKTITEIASFIANDV